MSEDIIKIKGTKSGLRLTFAKDVAFEDIEKDILDKFHSGSGFFVRGTEIFVPEGTLPAEQMERLRKLFHQHGLMFRTERRIEQPTPAFNPHTPAHPPVQSHNIQAPLQAHSPSDNGELQQMLVINRTLRGGQEITTKSSVLICGNVNPGAQIIAGGSIDIRGTCRGMVHAGAYGDKKAFIIADRLMPTQIRIANLIARSPDTPEETGKAERASVKDGAIVIESIER